MKTFLDATHFHFIQAPLPGTWGRHSMEAAGQIGLNIQLVPDGMALIGFTKDRRMAIIMYKEPGKDLELTKRFVRGRGVYSVPDFDKNRSAISRVPRAVIIGWIDNLLKDSK